MNKHESEKVILDQLSLVIGNSDGLSPNTNLIGAGAVLDSMSLVELCLALEDIADEHGFEFDWTSDVTMSKSRSMFRTVSTLAEEFANQSEV